MSNDRVSRGNQVIWFYGWKKAELAELLIPVVAICHIHEGSQVQSNMAPKFYFRGSVHEVNMVRGHMLIEQVHIKQVGENLWACNKDNWSQQHRPHIMMGKPTVLKMNVKGTVTGRMSCAKPNIKEIKRRP